PALRRRRLEFRKARLRPNLLVTTGWDGVSPSEGESGGLTQQGDDVAQGPEGPDPFGTRGRESREPILERREDLDPLDRVDAQVGVELHVQLEHLDLLPRLLGHA